MVTGDQSEVLRWRTVRRLSLVGPLGTAKGRRSGSRSPWSISSRQLGISHAGQHGGRLVDKLGC